MEKRRKALGLRKLSSNDGEKTATSTVAKKTTPANVKNDSEGKRPQTNQKVSVTTRNSKIPNDIPRASVTPKKTSPKTHQKLHSLKTESPASPLISPSQHAMVIHKMFRSPEVEVSWDWGCSQTVNEIVPVRRLTRANQSQPIPVADSISLSYPRLPPKKQISEEENQERLAFYKNILSLKGNQKEFTKNNNNIDKEVKADQILNDTTPKRPPKHKTESNKKDQVNSFFDDSANEFMLECSQAIEEQLRNGEISTASFINIDIGSRKHPHSPVEEPENTVKKVCHGKTKQNLFPESSKSLNSSDNTKNDKNRHLSLKSPKVKPSIVNSNCGKTPSCLSESKNLVQVENGALFMKPTQTRRPQVLKNPFGKESSNVNKNGIISTQKEASNLKDAIVKTGFASSDNTGNLITTENCSNLEGKSMLQNKISMDKKLVTSTIHNNINTNSSGKNLHYDSVNKFRRSQKSEIPKKHLNLHEPKGCDNIVKKAIYISNSVSKASVQEESLSNSNAKGVPNESLEGLVKVTRPKGVDVTPLLDDGFDMDLCSIDFDSLCCNSQEHQPKELRRQAVEEIVPKELRRQAVEEIVPKELRRQAVEEIVPKLCSNQEIEAKRLAALNRLMMKRKR